MIDGAHQGGGMLAGMHDDLAGSVAVREHPVHLDVAAGAGARRGGLKRDRHSTVERADTTAPLGLLIAD